MKHTALTLPDRSRSGPHTTKWSRTARESSSGLDFKSCGGPGDILPHDLGMDAPPLRSDTAGGVLIATPALTYSASGNHHLPDRSNTGSARIERLRGRS